MVGELKDGEVREYTVHPRQFGLAESALQEIQVSSPRASQEHAAVRARQSAGPARDIVALNAGAAIYVSGLARLA